MKDVRWGIVGLGRIAHKFASDLKYVEGSYCAAVASRSLDKARHFAREFDVPLAVGTYEELAARGGIDIVYIATPHTDHLQSSSLFLKKGIAVLCEKPLAMNYAQVSRMLDLSTVHSAFLMEALWTRFLPGTAKLLELIDSGAIGGIKSIEANFGFKAEFDNSHRVFNPELGGGALLDIGIYPAFLSYLLLGVPDDVEASCRKGSSGADVDTSFIFNYGNKAKARLHCTLEKTTSNEALITGSKGAIKIHSRFHEMPAMTLDTIDGHVQRFEFPGESFGYNYEVEVVANCVREGLLESHLWSHLDSLNLTRILDKVKNAADIVYEL